ncbi:MAG: DUF927 domain-containing protein [Ruminiclostridium sp.]
MGFTYKIEDFDTVSPYEELEKIENPFSKQLAEKQLEEYAKGLGYKHFKKMLASYRKSLKQPLAVADGGNITNFEGGDDLILKTWNADETGVWRVGRDNYREYACAHPIQPCQLLRNIDTGELKVKLRFKRGNSPYWTTQVVDFDTVANAKNIVSLSKIGISVTSGTKAQNLVDYICEAIDENYDNIEQIRSVSHLGWNREGFAPYIKDVEFDGNPNFDGIFRAITQKGSLDEWIDELVRCRKFSIVTHIVIAASFASCLIEPLGILPFFVHLWGMDSGTGKTVAQMAAASVWGNPAVGEPFFPTFKGTSTGFEILAGFLHSLPMIIDELQMAKDRSGKVIFNVYELAAGTGKLRGNKQLGLANVPTWNNCFITSGETPIVGEQDGAGALNRVIEIECTADNKCIEDGHATANILKQNYGFGGRVFILKLLEDGVMDTVKKLYEIKYSECLADKATEKQAHAAAAILTADTLASEWIFGDKPLSSKQMSDFLKTAETVSASARGYRYICDWVAMNLNRFGAVESGEIYGVIEGDVAYINRTVFNRACAEEGINPKALLSHLKSKGLLKTRKSNKGYSVTKRLPNAPPMDCVAVLLTENSDNSEDYDYDL